MEVIGTAGAAELAGLGELVGDGDNVGGLAVRVQREQGLEDDLVLGDVEVDALDRLDDIGNSILRQEHATEGTLLGEHVVRRRTF